MQSQLGFTAGYAVDFVTIIVLYTIATSMLWIWFHADPKSWPAATGPEEIVAVPASPNLVTGEG